MKQKLIELLEKYANVSDELIEIEKEIENLKNEIGENEATKIVVDWLNTEVGNA